MEKPGPPKKGWHLPACHVGTPLSGPGGHPESFYLESPLPYGPLFGTGEWHGACCGPSCPWQWGVASWRRAAELELASHGGLVRIPSPPCLLEHRLVPAAPGLEAPAEEEYQLDIPIGSTVWTDEFGAVLCQPGLPVVYFQPGHRPGGERVGPPGVERLRKQMHEGFFERGK